MNRAFNESKYVPFPECGVDPKDAWTKEQTQALEKSPRIRKAVALGYRCGCIGADKQIGACELPESKVSRQRLKVISDVTQVPTQDDRGCPWEAFSDPLWMHGVLPCLERKGVGMPPYDAGTPAIVVEAFLFYSKLDNRLDSFVFKKRDEERDKRERESKMKAHI